MTLKDAHTETGDNTTVVQLIRLVLYASYIEVTQYSSPSHHQPAERYEEYYVTYKRAIMSILNIIGRVFKKHVWLSILSVVHHPIDLAGFKSR